MNQWFRNLYDLLTKRVDGQPWLKRMKRWLRILYYLLSFALFIYIVWWGGPEAWGQIVAGDWRWLLAVLALQSVANGMAALRLRVTAVSLAKRPLAPWTRFFQLSMTARTLGLIMPRGLSTLGGKSVGLRAFGMSLQRGVWTVMVDNAFDVGLLGLLALPALLYFQGDVPLFIIGLVAGVVIILAAGLVWWGTAPDRLTPLWRWVRRWPWLAEKLNLTEETAVAPLPPSRDSLQILVLTLVLALTLSLGYFAVARAVGLEAPPWLFLACFPITQLSLIIAIAPGGLGIFDLGWLGLLRLGGVSEADALSFVIAQRAYIFVIVLLLMGASWLIGLLTDGETAVSPPDPSPNKKGVTDNPATPPK
jgi:uncharacterized membrane protein YbhN (UPF0104 family)